MITGIDKTTLMIFKETKSKAKQLKKKDPVLKELSEPVMQTILGVVPSKSNSYRINGAHLFKTAALTNYEKAFYMQCNIYRNQNIEGYFEFELNVFYPNNRSDLDGSLKVIMDCLQKVKAIKNDNRMVKLTAQKFIDKVNPRIEFIIKEIV